ncbi:pyridoxamine 5'-phosphate oxidase family protein [Actinomadura sp. KC345]|uniref:pyridoxamine 5'-phosphate oxidase family protein n=1 Tax=Actinomadura sp. KC345 TaxID=2530371 RepID=UPI001A9D115B|nr:pyridoxamine 5'-phosphate oxidase family protein [Actinomadura sp. KC345]
MIAVEDLDAHARALIEANLYMTLGTADADGRPWVSPVYFATADYAEFYWVSARDAAHSRNIAQRPQVSMVIFDSQVPAYHGRAVYLSGTAAELAGRDLDRGIQIYPGPVTRGGTGLALDDVTPPSSYRLYRATVTEASVLCPREPRRPCPLHSINADHRTPVLPWRDAR